VLLFVNDTTTLETVVVRPTCPVSLASCVKYCSGQVSLASSSLKLPEFLYIIQAA